MNREDSVVDQIYNLCCSHNGHRSQELDIGLFLVVNTGYLAVVDHSGCSDLGRH